MVQIYVDADACPVKNEIIRVARRHKLPVHMVANAWMRLDEGPLVHRVIVSDGFDAADDWIAEHAAPSDIVITSDIPLASRCLEAGAFVMDPKGAPFTPDSIGAALAMRDLNAHLRDIGEITGGARPFARQDRSNFLSALENLARRAMRAGRAG
jgi:uncharacterized protein YaiI (UPF0178 family)